MVYVECIHVYDNCLLIDGMVAYSLQIIYKLFTVINHLHMKLNYYKR